MNIYTLIRTKLLSIIPLSIQNKFYHFFHYELDTIPNGGFIGGMVIFATFMVYGIAVGLETCYGLLYANMLADADLIGADRGTLAWVGSIAIFLELALGILIGKAIDKYGARSVCIIGGLLMGGGLLLSSMVTRVEVLFITYSIVVGVGMAMAYGASSIAIGQYFTTRAPFANATAGIGTGVGTIILAYIIQLLLISNGWRSCMQFLSFISIIIVCLSGIAYIPLSNQLLHPTTPTSTTTTTGNDNNATSTDQTKEITEKENVSILNNEVINKDSLSNASLTTTTTTTIPKTEPLTGLSLLQHPQLPQTMNNVVGLQIRSPKLSLPTGMDTTHDDDHDSLPSTPLTSISRENNSVKLRSSTSIQYNLPESASSLSLSDMVPSSHPISQHHLHHPTTTTLLATSPTHSASAYPILLPAPSNTDRNISASSSIGLSLGSTNQSNNTLHRYHHDLTVSPYITANASPLLLSSNHEELIKVLNNNIRNTPLSPFLMPGAHSSAASIVPQVSLKTPALAALLRESNQRRQRSLTATSSFTLGNQGTNSPNIRPATSSLMYLQNQGGRFHHHQPMQNTSTSTAVKITSTPILESTNTTNKPNATSTPLHTATNNNNANAVEISNGTNSTNTTSTQNNDTNISINQGGTESIITRTISNASTATTNTNYNYPGYISSSNNQHGLELASTSSTHSQLTDNNNNTNTINNNNPTDTTQISIIQRIHSDKSITANSPVVMVYPSPIDEDQFVEALEIALNDKTPALPPTSIIGKFLHWIKLLPKRRMQQTSALYVWSDSRFWAIATTMALVVSSITIPETHLGAYVMDDIGLDPVFIGNLYSIMGLAGIIGRIIFGLITLFYDIDLLLLMQFCGITTGLSIFGLGIYGHYESYLIVNSIIIGGLGGAIFGFVSPILANLFGIPGLPYALGGTYTIRAPIVLIAAPIAGWVRQEVGSYTHIWTVTGLCLILSALPIALMSTKCRRIR